MLVEVSVISSDPDGLFTLAILGDAPPMVPEPSMWALLGVGVVCLIAVTLRRRVRPAQPSK